MYQKTGTLQLPVCMCAHTAPLQVSSPKMVANGHTTGLGVVPSVGLTLIKQEFSLEKERIF